MTTGLRLLKVVSYIGLLLTLLPALLVFAGLITLATYKWIMLGGTALYLFTAPFWINRED